MSRFRLQCSPFDGSSRSRFSIVLALSVLMLLGAAAQPAQAQELKKRIAVMSFEDKTDAGYSWGGTKTAGEGMADMLVTDLVQSERYIVLERSEINAVLDEQNLGTSGVVTAESAARVGEMLGAEIVVFGAITEFGYKERSTGGRTRRLGLGVKSTTAVVATDVRMVNATTGEIVAAESVRKSESKRGLSVDTEKIDFGSQSEFDESLVGEATREAIGDIVKMINAGSANVKWSASVITTQGSNVFINAGAAGGIENGQTFVVMREGQKLVDPDTGLELGSVEEQIGTIRVVDNTMGSGKAAKCEVVSGSGFERGDVVRMQE